MTKLMKAWLLLLCYAIPTPVLAQLDVVPGPPPGFEKLDTLHASMVNVSFGGNLLGAYPAHVTPNFVHWATPVNSPPLYPTC